MSQDIVSTSSRHRRRYLVSLVLALGAFIALAAPACSSSDVAANKAATEACSLNSDCASGLVCAIGRCRTQCVTSADCSGGSCVTDGKSAVCQLPAEKNTPCESQDDCPSPLACASDYRCRNLCQNDDNCNVVGITGRVCATDAHGVHYCADPPEVTNGVLTAAPPAGAKILDGGPAEPDVTVPFVVPFGGGSTTDHVVEEPFPLVEEPSPSDSEAGDVVTGPVCAQGCAGATVCVDGSCVSCGAAALPCCTNEKCLAAELSCNRATGLCECGGPNEACCGGNSCRSGLTCSTGDAGGTPTCACGLVGTTCCPGGDGGAPMCASPSLVCAGIKCSCIASVVDAAGVTIVQRLDGTVWMEYGGSAPFKPALGPSSGMLSATAIAASGDYTSPQAVGCGVVGGAVWCFPAAGSTTDSTYLGAGLSSSVTTSTAVQVVTSVGVTPTPLANVVQIAGGPYQDPDFCAVDSGGSIWCWGSNPMGVLGHGDTATSSYARQVMANASTPFANAVEVRVGFNSACARKTDGTVWCWGDNSYGEIGSGSTAPTQSLYPVEVSLPGSATRLAASPSYTPCAILQDTSVVCWGSNNDSQAGAPSSSATVGPTSVLTASGGSPLQGVIDVAPDDNGLATCANTTGSGLVCWGDAVHVAGGSRSASPYPSVVYDPGTAAPVQGISVPMAAYFSGSLTYINPYGLVAFGAGGTSGSLQPPCN